jgi:hypothetical protein
VARFSLKNPPEVFVSTTAMSAPVSRAVSAGKLRKLGSRLYTTNLTEDPASLVRRHLWDIAAGFFPGGLVADRTALEQRPASDGSVFLIASKGGNVALPGALRARRGLGPQPDDFKLRDNLYCMSTARALLENMRPSRAAGRKYRQVSSRIAPTSSAPLFSLRRRMCAEPWPKAFASTSGFPSRCTARCS